MRKKIFLVFAVMFFVVVGYSQPTNVDFSTGDLSGWTYEQAANNDSYLMSSGSYFASTQYSVLTTGAVEVKNIPITMSSPLGGNYVRIGNPFSGGTVYKLKQTFRVNAASPALAVSYAIVLEDAGHSCNEQPYFYFVIKDSIGNVIGNSNTYNNILSASCSSGDASFITSGQLKYKNWINSTFSLLDYISTNITVEFMVAGCVASQGAHTGYAYIDADMCSGGFSQNVLSVNNVNYNLLQSHNKIMICGTTNADVIAPAGATNYSWTGAGISGLNTQSVSITQAGTYTLVFDKPSPCSSNTSVTFTVGAIPTLSISSISNTVCPGSLITFSATGAVSYTWTPYSGNGNYTSSVLTATPNTSTIYTASGTGTNGCVGSSQYSVTVAASPTLSVMGNTNICSGNSTLLNALGADTYTWTGGITTPTIVLSPTINTGYQLTGKLNSAGCVKTIPFMVQMAGVVTYSPSVLRVCIGDSLTILTAGASSYTWSTGATTNSINVEPATITSYTLDATTICGIKQSVLTVTVNPLPNLPIVQVVSPICGGSAASFTTTSGMASYTWSSGSTSSAYNFTPTISSSAYTNSVSVKATSSVGCTNTNSSTYTVYPVPNINTSLSAGICVGDTSLLTASGANSYTWNPGAVVSNSVVISPTVSTTYSVLATDLVGCRSSQFVTVGVSPSPTLSVAANPSVVCFGKTTTLTASANGVVRWYLSDTASQHIASGLTYITPTLSIGSYTYYASSTCTNYLVRTPVAFTVSANPVVSVSSPSLFVCAAKPFQVVATGAHTYTWTSGYQNIYQVNDTLTSTVMANGLNVLYSVGAHDINGCTGTNTVLVKVYGNQIVNIVATPSIVCVESPSTLSLTGATSYTWSNGVISNSTVVTPTVTNVTYSVNLTNTFGCEQSNNVTLSIIAKPIVNATYIGGVSNTTLCAGNTQTLYASGASSYSWNTGETTSSIIITPTVTTTYTVTGEASNLPGCSTSIAKTVTVHAQPNIQITANRDTICVGSNLLMSASGANTYTWNNTYVASTYSATMSSPETFTVTGSNLYGCKQTVVKNIEIYATPQITATSTPALLCAGHSVTLSAMGALSYTWMPGALSGNSVVVNPTAPTIYTVTGTFGMCTNIKTLPISVIGTVITLSASVSNPITCTSPSATLTASGATSYTWNPGFLVGNNVVISPTLTTTYSLTGSTGSCTSVSTKTFVVSVGSSPNFTVAGGTICSGESFTINPIGASSYMYSGGSAIVSPTATTTYSISGTTGGTCTTTQTISVIVNEKPSFTIDANPISICSGSSATVSVNSAAANGLSYLWDNGATSQHISVNPIAATIYSVTVTDNLNGCIASNSTMIDVYALPTLTITGTNTVCLGTSAEFIAYGANTYIWDTGQTTSNISVSPNSNTTYTVFGTDINGCSNSQAITITVDNTCADVWPGDANSDGVADNLDVLELGLHYTQSGTPRASISNAWQSYFANNWVGNITNGKNLNHADCNGDGTINDDDTLAIYNNYGFTHTFKPVQTNTVNPQLSIVPDQQSVVKGNWGTASIYLGDPTSSINDINGIAFTVDFDNALIESNGIYIEYQNSFIDAGQNLHFRKSDFGNGKIFTASTHTVSNNVSGFGKIATLHYQTLSSITTEQVLNIGLSQGYTSNVSGTLSPLTSGTGTLLVLATTVGLDENIVNRTIQVNPNPTSGIINIGFGYNPKNTKIEIYNAVGGLILSESVNNTNHTINISSLSNGLYFVKILENNIMRSTHKVVKQ